MTLTCAWIQERKRAGRGWWSELLDNYATVAPEQMREAPAAQLSKFIAQAAATGRAAASRAVNWAPQLVEALLIPARAFYFLTDRDSLREGAPSQGPERLRERVLAAAEEVDQVLDAYVRGRLTLAVIAAVVVTTGLFLAGIGTYVTLGLLAGVTRAIPVIGPIIWGIPIVTTALILKGWKVATAVLVFFVILHLVESKIIMPKVVGRRLRLRPVTAITALLVGGESVGVLGMFIAAPRVAVAKVVVSHCRMCWWAVAPA
jgi:predicted PurR-regulated permease PerM